MNLGNKIKLNPYERLYNRSLSFDEIKQTSDNLAGFFIELIEADKENRSNN